MQCDLQRELDEELCAMQLGSWCWGFRCRALEQLHAGRIHTAAEGGKAMIVATRKLVIMSSPPQTVEVRIVAPVPLGLGWKCAFEIVWPNTTDRSHAMGADGVQALNLALQSVAAHLYMSPYHKQQLLVWQEAGAGYGFPLHPKSRDLAIGEDRFM